MAPTPLLRVARILIGAVAWNYGAIKLLMLQSDEKKHERKVIKATQLAHQAEIEAAVAAALNPKPAEPVVAVVETVPTSIKSSEDLFGSSYCTLLRSLSHGLCEAIMKAYTMPK